MRPADTVWKKLVFSLVTSICTLSVLFLVFVLYSYVRYLQEIESLYRQMIGENGITYLKTSANDTLMYEFRENYFHKGHSITNGEGIRSDRDYLKQKPSAVTRIACIGDSITAGPLARPQDAYPAILENLLNDGEGEYEVLNFGVYGYGIDQELEVLRKKTVSYHPDVVVLGYSIRDITLFDTPATFFRTFCITHLFEDNSDLITLSRIQDMYRDRTLVVNLLAKLHECKKVCDEHNIRLVVCIFPTITDFKTYPFMSIHKMLRYFCRELNIEYVDLLQEYSGYHYSALRETEQDLIHPNSRGQKIAAMSLCKEILATKSHSTQELSDSHKPFQSL